MPTIKVPTAVKNKVGMTIAIKFLFRFFLNIANITNDTPPDSTPETNPDPKLIKASGIGINFFSFI
jgi:hypothetical protein